MFQDGDIIVVGSDGLFDNLHVAEIIDVLNQTCLPTVMPTRGVSKVPLVTPQEIAQKLVDVSSFENPRMA